MRGISRRQSEAGHCGSGGYRKRLPEPLLFYFKLFDIKVGGIRMTSYVRTWVEQINEATGLRRWSVCINDTPVPGGYIEECGAGCLEVYYPHLQMQIFDSLQDAKNLIEFLPPLTSDGLPVGSETDAGDELISTEKAGSFLGVSRFRINAMIVNGALAAAKREGQYLVGRESVERYRAQMSKDD
jgi:hypothetical protein